MIALRHLSLVRHREGINIASTVSSPARSTSLCLSEKVSHDRAVSHDGVNGNTSTLLLLSRGVSVCRTKSVFCQENFTGASIEVEVRLFLRAIHVDKTKVVSGSSDSNRDYYRLIVVRQSLTTKRTKVTRTRVSNRCANVAVRKKVRFLPI